MHLQQETPGTRNSIYQYNDYTRLDARWHIILNILPDTDLFHIHMRASASSLWYKMCT